MRKHVPVLAFYFVLIGSTFLYAAWTTPRTWVTGEVVTAAQMNTHVRDNLNELRGGGIAISSQAAGDVICASSSTQLGRVAAGATTAVLQGGGASTCPFYTSTPSVTSLATSGNVSFGGQLVGAGTNSVLTMTGSGYQHTLSNSHIYFDLDANNNETGVFHIRRGSDFVSLMTVEESAGNVAMAGIITSASVGTAALRTATASSALTVSASVTMQDYSFFPNIEQDDCGQTSLGGLGGMSGNQTNDTVGRFDIIITGAACGSGSMDVRYRYITASDNPDIWIAVNNTSQIVGVWQSEDPADVAPLGIAGATVSRLDVPSVAEIKAIYSILPVTIRKQAATEFLAYLVSRGWATEGMTVAEAIDQIPDRYKRAARLWALRAIAKAANVDVAELILETMTTQDGRVVPKANYDTVVDAYRAARAARLNQ